MRSHNSQYPMTMAAKAIVDGFEYQGQSGAVAMAAFLKVTPRYLNNQLNPNLHQAKLGADDLLVIERTAHNYSGLYAHAAQLGHACFLVPHHDMPIGDVDLVLQITTWQSAVGHTCDHIRETLDDGRVEYHEVDEIRRRAFAHMSEFMRLLAMFELLAEPVREVANG